MQGRSPDAVPHVRIGAVVEQDATLPAVTVIGVVVQERAFAGALVDVPPMALQ